MGSKKEIEYNDACLQYNILLGFSTKIAKQIHLNPLFTDKRWTAMTKQHRLYFCMLFETYAMKAEVLIGFCKDHWIAYYMMYQALKNLTDSGK